MTTLPPSTPLVRDIAYELWKVAVMAFDGTNPVVAKTETRHPNIWSYTVEVYGEKPMCVTRKNGIVAGMISASVFR
jgi:hypothetical protein